MRTRIIMAGFLVCAGIVMMTLRTGRGQAVKEGADPRASAAGATSARARLMEQVAVLRAEIDLLDLEHDVDRELLRDALKDQRNLVIAQASQSKLDEKIEGLKREFKDQVDPPLPFLPEEVREAAKKSVLDDTAKDRAIDGAMVELMGPILDRMKKEYQEKTATIERKKLELTELERRLKEAH